MGYYMDQDTNEVGTYGHFDYMDGDTLRNKVDEGGAYQVRWTGIDWIPTYCTQNEGECRTCPLASDGFDCAGHHYR